MLGPVTRRVVVSFLVVVGASACSSAADTGAKAPTDTDIVAAAAPAAGFDAAMARHWTHARVEPVEPVDDATFLRRATLDLWGRIPRPEEVASFAADPRQDKRARRVDVMLADRRWAEHWGDTLTETLLGSSGPDAKPRLAAGLSPWLTDALHDGRGWDAITTDLLTATGDVTEGPATFVAAHGRKNQVEALTGQTARVFLGLSVQCAQCHDHPDDTRYVQRDFYGLAAAFAQTRARRSRGGLFGGDTPRTFEVIDRPRGQLRMPRPQDGPGERTGPIVAPRFPGLDLAPRDGETRRQALARAVVASPLLDAAIVNRVWASLMSHGFVDPVDEQIEAAARLGADPRQPEALRVLADEFATHGRDLRWLARRIVLSDAYQRSSEGPADGADSRRQAFAQFAVRPLTDDQLLASLLVATGVDSSTDRRLRRRVKVSKPKLQKQFAFVFDDDEMAGGPEAGGTVPQALLLLNGELTSHGAAAQRDTSLSRILEASDDPAARIDAMYVATVSHWPDETRREQLLTFVADRGDARAAYEDLMHALLTSAEFSTNH